MATVLKIEGNFLVLYDSVSPFTDKYRHPRSDTKYKYIQRDAVDYFQFSTLLGQLNSEIAFNDLIDAKTGLSFNSVDELKEFLSLNLATTSTGITGGLSNDVIYINDKSNFPEPSSGVITLANDTTYIITTDIDLTGDRLVASGICNLFGLSSETSSITSTGLGTGVPLITSEYTIVVEKITFKDVDFCFDINGNSRTVALDWKAVNFSNIPNVWIINTCDNFIFDTGAFLGAQGAKFTGTIGTVALNNSLFSGTGSVGNIIEFDSGLTITRRFRTIYSSIISFGSTTAINLNASATIPNSGVILDTCNINGGGTYLTGIDYTSNKALFVNNVGIVNSREVSNYYMNGNATSTTVLAIGTAYKIAGTTTSSAITSKFTNTNNRSTYTGSISRIFKVIAVLSVESGNNNVIGIYIAKNGVVLPDSEIYITTNAGGRAEGATVQALTVLEENDYIEIFVENDTSITDITVTDLNVIIE
jgi:hypothetical protein